MERRFIHYNLVWHGGSKRVHGAQDSPLLKLASGTLTLQREMGRDADQSHPKQSDRNEIFHPHISSGFVVEQQDAEGRYRTEKTNDVQREIVYSIRSMGYRRGILKHEMKNST